MAIPLNMERSLLQARQWYSQLRWGAPASRAAVLCCSLMCLHPVTRYGNYGLITVTKNIDIYAPLCYFLLMRLSQYAKQMNVSYKTAFLCWKAGRLYASQLDPRTLIFPH